MLLCFWLLTMPPLASQTADSLSGGAGWVGAGLLGLVLSWLLLKHLPDKAKEYREEIDRHLEAEASQRANHIELEKEQRNEYRATLQLMLQHSEKQVETLANALRADLQSLQEAVNEMTKLMDNLARRNHS